MKNLVIVMLVAFIGSIAGAAYSTSFEVSDGHPAATSYSIGNGWWTNGSPDVRITTGGTDGAQTAYLGSGYAGGFAGDLTGIETSEVQFLKYDFLLGDTAGSYMANNIVHVGGNWSKGINSEVHANGSNWDLKVYNWGNPGWVTAAQFAANSWVTIGFEMHLNEAAGADYYDVYVGPYNGALTLGASGIGFSHDIDHTNVTGVNPLRMEFWAGSATTHTVIDNIQYGAGAVPEPMTVALLGLGGLLIRRKK